MRIKDVAREAGVSTATVSHVINKTKYVRDNTRDKVLLAIEKIRFLSERARPHIGNGAKQHYRSARFGHYQSEVV